MKSCLVCLSLPLPPPHALYSLHDWNEEASGRSPAHLYYCWVAFRLVIMKVPHCHTAVYRTLLLCSVGLRHIPRWFNLYISPVLYCNSDFLWSGASSAKRFTSPAQTILLVLTFYEVCFSCWKYFQMPWHMSISVFLSVDGKKDTVISKQKVIFFIGVVWRLEIFWVVTWAAEHQATELWNHPTHVAIKSVLVVLLSGL